MKSYSKNLMLLVPVLIFGVIAALYLAPSFSGKIIKQGDIQQYSGASKEILDYKAKEGKNPLWTNSMFGGMPSYQISFDPPNNYAKYLRNITPFKHPVNTLFFAMVFSYILLLAFNVNYWLAAIGAFAYAFSSYNLIILEAGHNTKLYAIAYAPLVLAGFKLCLNKKYLIGAAVSSIGIALQLQANHYQITYYVLIILLCWGISEFIIAIKTKAIKQLVVSVLIFAISSIIGVGTNAVSLLLTKDYSEETIRGKSELTISSDNKKKEVQSSGLDIDYAFDWSQGWEDLPTILIPNFAGGGSGTELGNNDQTKKYLQQMAQSQDQQQAQQAQYFLNQKTNPWAYWGSLPFTSGPVYFGALILFLFTAGMFYFPRNDIQKWWWLAALVLSLFLSMGKNLMWFNSIFFHYFPMYNKFRSVNMSLVIGQIVVAIFAAISLNKILAENVDKAKAKSALKKALYITGGFCLLMILYSGAAELGDPTKAPAETMADRASYLRKDALRSLFFIVAGFAAFWYYFKEKLTSVHIKIAVGIIILLDLWLVDRRYLNDKSWEKEKSYQSANFTPNEADLEILKDKSYYRVFDATASAFNSARASYFHHSVGGYHAAKLRRFQEVVEWHITKNDMDIMNMLNVKYYIMQDQTTGKYFAQKNDSACGNAWFVKEYKIMKNSDEEIKTLGTIAPSKTAIVDKRYENMLKNENFRFDSSATIKFEKYDPDKLQYSYTSASPQIVVFSEIYYNEKKGWNAYIDGKKVPHFRCDYILRGMVVPEGSHKIEFRFEPQNFNASKNIALASNAAMYLLLFAGIGSLFFKKKK
ncbi:MAG: hypothetical protein HUU47_06215 [Bacteroidetes bacterium]|nr:hypothetical protein [Bacteroidota bacterium]